MIIPNLLVTNISRSVKFYRDQLGLSLSLSVDSNRNYAQDGTLVKEAVFAIMEWQGHQLMLQTARSLAQELSPITADQQPTQSGTIYFRGFDSSEILSNIPKEQIIKGPELNWYGMKELYLTDPDGYILCLGCPEGKFNN